MVDALDVRRRDTQLLLVDFVEHHYDIELEPCSSYMKHSCRWDPRFTVLEPYIEHPFHLRRLAKATPELEFTDLGKTTATNPKRRPNVYLITLRGRPFQETEINDEDLLYSFCGQLRLQAGHLPEARSDLGLAYELDAKFTKNPWLPEMCKVGILHQLVKKARAMGVLYWDPILEYYEGQEWVAEVLAIATLVERPLLPPGRVQLANAYPGAANAFDDDADPPLKRPLLNKNKKRWADISSDSE